MTIFALSSAPGRAAVAVLRVSGPAAGEAVRALTGRAPPAPRRAVLRRLVDPADGRGLDRGLVLRFEAPASATGEDLAEFHVHGGRAVVAGVLGALARLPGLRPAEPGEFTRRALLNGKLDLTAAEAVADLVAADTARQRDQALAQAAGEAARRYEGWRGRLVARMARLEAAIDFADEVEEHALQAREPLRGLDEALAALAAEIEGHLDDDRRSERLRRGLDVVILGAPNVGKSSLLNLLARQDAAIVAEQPGTTRDVVDVSLDIAGFAVTLADTAGLRAAAGPVEAEGMRRARARAAAADVKLLVVDAARPAETRAAVADLIDERAFPIANKIDLAPPPSGMQPVSCAREEGIDALIAALGARLETLWSGAGTGPARARHRAGLEQAAAALRRAVAVREAALKAEDLRLAATALGRLTGRVDVEDLLDVIFAEFCIGK